MKKLATTSLLLVIMLVSVSAYLRLDNSGIGCPDWPSCYGQIGVPELAEPTVGSTYERLAEEARQPLSWATPVHRLVASVLGLTVLGIALLSLRVKRDRLISFAMLGLTVFLAWLGIYSGGLHSPGVVMGNLAGGFTLLGLLGWMTFRNAKPRANAPKVTKIWTTAALAWLMVQMMTGGLTSANFAASACQTLPDCHGSYLPGDQWSRAFDISRSHEIGPTGLALGGSERADIHKLHQCSNHCRGDIYGRIFSTARETGLERDAGARAGCRRIFRGHRSDPNGSPYRYSGRSQLVSGNAAARPVKIVCFV
jgi:cytochrome c oxidase assembly protein subunit 15